MEEYIEVSAKTKEEAIMNAAIQLGTSSDNIEYDVIQEATSGLFGIGRKPAIIRARKKKDILLGEDISLDFEEAVRDPLKDISAKKSFMKKPAKKFTKEPVKKQPEKTVEKKEEKPVEKKPERKPENQPQPKAEKEVEVKKEEGKTGSYKRKASDQQRSSRERCKRISGENVCSNGFRSLHQNII